MSPLYQCTVSLHFLLPHKLGSKVLPPCHNLGGSWSFATNFLPRLSKKENCLFDSCSFSRCVSNQVNRSKFRVKTEYF